jgi:methylglutaconyl-CoA hydratase
MSDGLVALQELGGGVFRLMLNRPEKANAVNARLARAVARELARASALPGVRLVRICGSGKHFCAGGDISADEVGREATDRTADFLNMLDALDRFPRPLLAHVHGGCIGIGLALASRCDAIVAESDAFFSLPEGRLGIGPGALFPYFLAALGPRYLRWLVLSGERLDAGDAWRIGLVQKVVERGEAEAAFAQMEASFLATPADAFQGWKSKILACEHMAHPPRGNPQSL